MVKKVKRAENYIIRAPFIIDENESIEKLNEIKRELDIQSFLVTSVDRKRGLSFDEDDVDLNEYDVYKRVFTKKNMEANKDFKLKGIITARDLKA